MTKKNLCVVHIDNAEPRVMELEEAEKKYPLYRIALDGLEVGDCFFTWGLRNESGISYMKGKVDKDRIFQVALWNMKYESGINDPVELRKIFDSQLFTHEYLAII